jgi:hypothetical protein
MANISKSLIKAWSAMEEDRGIRVRNFYVERRPDGDYAVRKATTSRASAVAPTQAKAIERAREMHPGCSLDVERVRHTSVGKPDRWRKA